MTVIVDYMFKNVFLIFYTLSLIPPPKSVPGSSRGVAGLLQSCLLAMCPSWPDRGPDIRTPDVQLFLWRHDSVGRWPNPGAQYGASKLLPEWPVRTCATVIHWSLDQSRCQRW